MIFHLKILTENDVTNSYVNWFKNSNVIRYSNNQYRKFSLEGQKNFVNYCLNNKNIDLYGIFHENTLIGNIKITGIKNHHKNAEISYVIGNTDYWGKGAASFAISKIIEISKTNYKLYKLFAGVAEENIASVKVLNKNKFILEGKRPNHLFFCGKFYNQLDYGLIL